MPTYIINKNNILFEVKNINIIKNYHYLIGCIAREANSLDDFAAQMENEKQYAYGNIVAKIQREEKFRLRKMFFIDVNNESNIECKNCNDIIVAISGDLYDFINDFVYAHSITGTPYLIYRE